MNLVGNIANGLVICEKVVEKLILREYVEAGGIAKSYTRRILGLFIDITILSLY